MLIEQTQDMSCYGIFAGIFRLYFKVLLLQPDFEIESKYHRKIVVIGLLLSLTGCFSSEYVFSCILLNYLLVANGF